MDVNTNNIIYCTKKCCKLKYSVSESIFKYKNCPQNYTIKCGSIILDNENRLLLTQSYNSFWGVPKGSQEPGESFENVCIRETYEETGIKLSKDQISISHVHIFFIHKKLFVFFLLKLNCKFLETNIPKEYSYESTGCGWVKIECLLDIISKNDLKVNIITKFVSKILFNIKN